MHCLHQLVITQSALSFPNQSSNPLHQFFCVTSVSFFFLLKSHAFYCIQVPKQQVLFVKSAERFKVLVINTPQLLLLRNEIFYCQASSPDLNRQILKELLQILVLQGFFSSLINITHYITGTSRTLPNMYNVKVGFPFKTRTSSSFRFYEFMSNPVREHHIDLDKLLTWKICPYTHFFQ